MQLFFSMQQVQKTRTQYGLRSLTQQTEVSTDDNMATTPGPSQTDTATKIATIKMLLQGIASDMSGLKSRMDAVQTAVDKLKARLTEVESPISALEDQGQNIDVTVSTETKTIVQLQEKVIYLEDASRRNNVRIVRIEEGAEDRDMPKWDMLLVETLDIEMGPEFEIERAHRAGQRGNRYLFQVIVMLQFI